MFALPSEGINILFGGVLGELEGTFSKVPSNNPAPLKSRPKIAYGAYAQAIVPGFSSVITMGCRKATALRRPSSMDIRLSSCSMESTRS